MRSQSSCCDPPQGLWRARREQHHRPEGFRWSRSRAPGFAGPRRGWWRWPPACPSGSRRAPARDRRASFDAFHKNLDLAAASEPDLPGLLVADAEGEEPRLAVLDSALRLADDRAFDAAARDRAQKRAVLIDDELRADRPRRRAPGGDHCRQRHALAGGSPFARLVENLLIVVHPLTPLRARRRRLRADAGRAASTLLPTHRGSPDCAPGETRRHGAGSPASLMIWAQIPRNATTD